MKIFKCANCQQVLFYENSVCVNCSCLLGFNHLSAKMLTFSLDEHGVPKRLKPRARRFRFCQNRETAACNWLLSQDDPNELCGSCRYTRTAPDLSTPLNKVRFGKLETAKRRLLYSLNRLGYLHLSKLEDTQEGLAFDFLASKPSIDGEPSKPVLTGHAGGLITINIAEADDANRESIKEQMSERYRTLLGHFRHETGHYIWDRLFLKSAQFDSSNTTADEQPLLEQFRALFGDERADYAAALENHYENGAPLDWQNNFISTYASTHPWEDWAECFAHYLHIIDTLETAWAFGLKIDASEQALKLSGSLRGNPYQVESFAAIFNAWLPVSLALNSLNRSMGQPDAYPFVTPDIVRDKLEFVHRCMRSALTEDKASLVSG